MLDELKNIAIADYDYPLPDELIARYPMAERDHSRLLRLTATGIDEHRFDQLPGLLPSGSLLVFNNTKVIHARLFFRKFSGATIEVFCLEPYLTPVAQAFEMRERCTWLCLIGNNKRWREGSLSLEFRTNEEVQTLTATRRQPEGDSWLVDFEWTGGASFAEVIDAAGVIPLPPYLGREAEEADSQRYQTVYARHEGSVAAPTAGLHFTPKVLNDLADKGIETEYITLHVGAGTFKPVATATIGDHAMHTEQVQISADNPRRLIAHEGHKPIAVGTTTVRTLESVYWFGAALATNPDLPAMSIDQWEPYRNDSTIGSSEAFANVVAWLERQGKTTLDGETRLIIAPGYRYRTIGGLITNFHQPKSTLLLLVSALVGDRWREAYKYAIEHHFRFLSYGDSCLLLPWD